MLWSQSLFMAGAVDDYVQSFCEFHAAWRELCKQIDAVHQALTNIMLQHIGKVK